MPKKTDAEQIIEQSQVGGLKNTFVLGCKDRRVTFNTQQTRAFNLVWALFDQGQISKGSKVAVVGGGLAGMTAAAALNLKACKVTLFHEKQHLMNIQKDNYQRYIHPNIYDWPQQGCENTETDFPCMNWRADDANNVVEEVLERWKLLSAGITVRCGLRIDEVKNSGNKPRVYFRQPTDNEAFDCVILAVGFGVESNFNNTRFASYWNIDELEQDIKTQGTKHYLISGCGDGGLIDALRVRISGFNHEEFTNSLLDERISDELKDKLIQIDKDAPENEEDFATYITDEYKKLDIPVSLTEALKERLKPDTSLELNGTLSTPMSPRSCLINRFSLFLLMKVDIIAYEQGKITAVIHHRLRSVTIDKGASQLTRVCDEVIVRHGPEEVLTEIIGKSVLLPAFKESEKILKKAWPEDFYPERTELTNTESLADKYYSAFKKKISRIDRSATVFVIQYKGTDIYMVRSDKYQDIEVTKIKAFKKVMVKHGPQLDLKLSSARGEIMDSQKLTLGSKIKNSNNQEGTLGCFVRLLDEQVGFLSSAHLFEGENTEVFFQRKGEKPLPVGHLFKKSNLRKTSESKRQVNIIDAALLLIKPGVAYSTFTHIHEKRIAAQGMASARLGERVYKVGNDGNLRYGEVSGTRCSIMLDKGNIKYYFEEAIMVSATDGEDFAVKGDSGAMVFREDGKILGMIFATGSNVAILCPIAEILREFQCSLMIY